MQQPLNQQRQRQQRPRQQQQQLQRQRPEQRQQRQLLRNLRNPGFSKDFLRFKKS
mgnify:CR=1 FL=1